MECSGLKWNEVNGLEIEEDGNANGIGKEKVLSAPPSGHTSRNDARHAMLSPTATYDRFPRVSACPWGPNVALSPKNLLPCVLYQICRCDQGRTQSATKIRRKKNHGLVSTFAAGAMWCFSVWYWAGAAFA